MTENERLTNSDKEIPTLNDNAKYWLQVYFKLKDYEAIGTIEEFKALKEKKENGLMLEWPCKVGDKAYLVGKDENGHPKVYEGVWDSISMAQRKNGNFEVCGHISYDVYDFFYDDGRTMLHGMYVGQENTKFGKVVFLTKEEAEEALSKSET